MPGVALANFAHYFWPGTLGREVLLEGAGLSDVAGQIGILAITGVVVLALAVRQYRKRSA